MAKCSKFKTIQNSTMSRGCSFGGGQSSLGYLFESDDPPTPPLPPKSSSKVTNSPSNDEAKGAKGTTNAAPPTSLEETTSTIYTIYHRKGQDTGNIITVSIYIYTVNDILLSHV